MYDQNGAQAISDAAVSCVLDGADHQLSLYDLSPSGCMLEAPKAFVPRGRQIVVNFFRNLAVPARVAWQRGGRIGLQFLLPLDKDLVGCLSLTIRQVAAERYTFHDSFGRPVSGMPTFPNVLASLHPQRSRPSLRFSCGGHR